MGGWGRACMVAALLLSGVVAAPVVASAKDGEKPASDASAARDLSTAQKMMRGGNFSQAIPRLLKVLETAPHSREGIEAHYQLGIAYEAIQDLRGAQIQLNHYLELAPDGEFAEDARARVARLSGTLEEQFVSPDEIDARIAKARQDIQLAPGEVGPRLNLADLLWSKGDYAGSGEVYVEILRDWPKLADDMVIRQRMRRDADGTWTVLDPKTVVLEAAEADPLIIFNTSSFRSGRQEGFARSFQNQKYNVTGEAMNRGQAPLDNVELIVTILGFGGRVFETKSVRVGRMAPGESRPFSVVFENFDSIDNVERFQVKGTFTR